MYSPMNILRKRSREMTANLDFSLSTPRHYISRKFSHIISDSDLPLESNARGINSPVGIILLLIRLTVPLAYIYISLILLRELLLHTLQPLLDAITSPHTTPLTHYQTLFTTYLPYQQQQLLANFLKTISHDAASPPTTLLTVGIEYWSILEVLFYLSQKLRIRSLQHTDPIEASLSSAPLLECWERSSLWRQMMHQLDDMGKDGSNGYDPTYFIRGWFFGEELERITRYDMLDFCAWCMFEGRNQEHLTDEEVGQLKGFVEEFEWRLSFHLYGSAEEGGVDGEEEEERGGGRDMGSSGRRNLTCQTTRGDYVVFEEEEVDVEVLLRDRYSSYSLDALSAGGGVSAGTPTSSLFANTLVLEWVADPDKRPKPRKEFHFRETSLQSPHNLFEDLFEALKKRFPPLHDIRTYAAKRTRAAASNAYESILQRLIGPNHTNFDKRLQAIGENTHRRLDEAHRRLDEAWASVCKMKERLELKRQLEGYRKVLVRMRGESAAAPTRQLAELLRNITKCNERLVQVERSALMAFWKATGTGREMLSGLSSGISMSGGGRGGVEPQRYAKYSNDPLLGLATYPLAFHLVLYGFTDGLLRVLMRGKGFQRLTIGHTAYYYHPGRSQSDEDYMDDFHDDFHSSSSTNTNTHDNNTPLVFCHGIGVGLIYYLTLIDELLKHGKALFLPEIPYVCGFRPWLSRNSILTPSAVTSTLTAMLASHGFLKATFVGHSYGTSWLSYMCKYASHAIAAVLFLDPICFCLHHPCLTKSFVYHRADPGNITYMVKTDLMINWTIQRSFPWARIVLFIEDIPEDIPCGVYLSEKDFLVPADIVEGYFRRNGVTIVDYREEGDDCIDNYDDDNDDGEEEKMLKVVVFRGDAHGDWSDRRLASVHIANTARMLTEQYERSI